MRADEFVAKVRTLAEFESNDQAYEAIEATLDTLRQRLTGNEPRNLASQLPPEIAGPLDGEGGGEDFSISEFYDRVAEKENAGREEATGHARAVTATVQELVTAGELDDVREQLKGEFEELVGSKGDA